MSRRIYTGRKASKIYEKVERWLADYHYPSPREEILGDQFGVVKWVSFLDPESEDEVIIGFDEEDDPVIAIA